MWPGDERKQARYRRLFRMLDLPKRSRVLEVGCGAGGASRFLVEAIGDLAMVVGVDPSRLAVAEALRLTPTHGHRPSPLPVFAAMDGRRLGFCDGAFDAVFCSRVLVHAHDPETIVREMVRVVRSGGRMLLVEPDRDGSLTSADFDEVHRVFWSDRRSVNPQIGRKLYPILHAVGLDVQLVEPWLNVSTGPPSEAQVAQIEQELHARRGEWWSLVESGRITADQLQGYVASLRKARSIGVYLRCDLEFAYLARKP